MFPDAEELAPGLHRWIAYHPEWKRNVSSVAYDAEDGLVLVDPLAPPADPRATAFWDTLDRRVDRHGALDILITIHYHRRSTPAILERYTGRASVGIWAPTGALEQLAVESARALDQGAVLPGGFEARPAGRPDEVVLWHPGAKALIAGDALVATGRRPLRVCAQSWLPRDVRRRDVAEALLPLLELQIGVVIPAHGSAVTGDAPGSLSRALDEARG